ncbi:ArnT family glycosyltransferase [Singulisphaera sp. PoT]|uniref:ArnT family glycosyltransferase n=1 Tax=Singulisphaera sp. PoT TaxID=3411797 RepID=UPI003BF5EB0E
MAIPFQTHRAESEAPEPSRRLVTRRNPFRGEWIIPLLPAGSLIVLWGFIFSIHPPGRQDFPLVDDWAYSRGLFGLARGEGIHYFHQPSMPLLGQWLLAYPAVLVAGESHAALRVVTISLAMIGILAFYDLLRRVASLSRGEASFVAASLALNPIFVMMCGCFMTDVPSLSISLAALALYIRALRGGGSWQLVLASAVATLATITRQNAVVVPLVAGILLLQCRDLRWRPSWYLGVGLPLIAGILVHRWFTARPDSLPMEPRMPSARDVLVLCYTAAIYMGLTVLPLLALRPGLVSRVRYAVSLFALLNGVALCIQLGDHMFPPRTFYGGLFPYLPHMFTPWGVLEDNFCGVGARPLMMGRNTQWVVTVLACVGGAALADRGFARLRAGWAANPFLLFTILHATILLASPVLFDRYLIVLMPGALALTAGAARRARWTIGLAVLAISATFSVCLVHDWYAWNSARWDLGRRALARGISVDDIEGGFEWDSWYAPGPVVASPFEPLSKFSPGLMLPFNHVRHPHITGRYALAFSQIPGTIVLDSEPYRLWLIPGKWHFLLLEQQEADQR